MKCMKKIFNWIFDTLEEPVPEPTPEWRPYGPGDDLYDKHHEYMTSLMTGVSE